MFEIARPKMNRHDRQRSRDLSEYTLLTNHLPDATKSLYYTCCWMVLTYMWKVATSGVARRATMRSLNISAHILFVYVHTCRNSITTFFCVAYI